MPTSHIVLVPINQLFNTFSRRYALNILRLCSMYGICAICSLVHNLHLLQVLLMLSPQIYFN